MTSRISPAEARRGSGRLLPPAPNTSPGRGTSFFQSRAAKRPKAGRRDRLSAPFADSRRDTNRPPPDFTLPARVSLRSRPRGYRRRFRSSINPLHQLVPRAAESFPQACSDRDGRLRVAALDPLKVGAVDLGKLAELLLRETRFRPQTGEISAEDIRRRHPCSLTIPASQGRRIYAAFFLADSMRPPASLLTPLQEFTLSQKRNQDAHQIYDRLRMQTLPPTPFGDGSFAVVPW